MGEGGERRRERPLRERRVLFAGHRVARVGVEALRAAAVQQLAQDRRLLARQPLAPQAVGAGDGANDGSDVVGCSVGSTSDGNAVGSCVGSRVGNDVGSDGGASD